jgi:hypothetical protein
MVAMTLRRAHSIVIEAGADDKDELIAALGRIIFDLSRGSTGATSGSPSAGYHFTYTVDPEMTHERYMAAIEALADRLMEYSNATCAA